MGETTGSRGWVLACLLPAALAACAVPARTPSSTRTQREQTFVYPDAMGRPVAEHSPGLPGTFAPPERVEQVPRARRGIKAPDTRLERLRADLVGIEWFSSKQPGLAPYLSSLDELGNTAVVPGAPIAEDPLSRLLQDAKYRLSSGGFHYTMEHALEYARLTQIRPDERNLGYYTFDFHAKQTVFTSPEIAGCLSTEVVGGAGLGARSRRTSPSASLGSITNPAASLSPVNGVAVSELAWQQSFAHGRLVALVGSLDQTNYLDTNAYANSPFGQFANSALANSQVLPLTAGNLGASLQWQPLDDAYLMLGAGGNRTPAGGAPWDHLGAGDMSYVLEMGHVPDDALGIGPGAYRLQPFLATVHGTTQGGLALNLNQQLGHGSPVGWFGRFGVGGPVATSVGGASAQVATGVVLQHPLRLAHLLAETTTDFLGAGFVWSQPAADLRPAANFHEYGAEVVYAFQVTATTFIKPDLQVVWNPASNRHVDNSVVVQIPLVAAW